MKLKAHLRPASFIKHDNGKLKKIFIKNII